MNWKAHKKTGSYYAQDKEGNLWQRPMLKNGLIGSINEICEIDIHTLSYFELDEIKNLTG